MSCLHLQRLVCDICDARYCVKCEESKLYAHMCKKCANNEKFGSALDIQNLVSEIQVQQNINIFSDFEELQIYLSGVLYKDIPGLTDSDLFKQLKLHLTRKFS